MSEFEQVSGLVSPLGAKLHMVDGECAEHGKASMLTRVGLAWHCPQCMDIAKGSEFVEQAIAERLAHLRKIADIPTRYRGAKFLSPTPEQKMVRLTTARFRDFVVAEGRWACLILDGGVGTGKTLLACEFAESYISKFCRSVRYVTAKGMISEIQASYGREGKSEDSEIDRFVQYDMLILDEIDAIPAKDNAALLLTEIVNRRYGNDKPMIVITNQPMGNLKDFVGDRVLDRMYENGFVCMFDWPSFRRQTQA